MSRILSLFLLLGLLAAAPFVAAQDEMASNDNDIVSVLQADGSFTTLLSALDTAGLTEALATGGPYTLFAPTDDAFAALPAGTLDDLSAEELSAILQVHVLNGAVMAADAAALTEAPTLQGSALSIHADAGMLYINDAAVTRPDLEASNGVIHVIDTVLLPAPADDMDHDGMDMDDEMSEDDDTATSENL